MADRDKFKVWDVALEEWASQFNSDSIDRFFINYKGELMIDPSGFDEYRHEELYENYRLVRCTGIKDKNGTLIYEGDYVGDETGISEAVWLEKRKEWGFDRLDGVSYGYSVCIFILKYWEIKGNCFENPELDPTKENK